MSKTKEAEQLVDLILDGSYIQVKEANKKTDRILDQITGPPPMKDKEDVEEGEGEIKEPESNVIDEVPEKNIATIKKDIEKEVTEEVTGPGGHVPDKTGPHGRGMGPGKGTKSGLGIKKKEEEEEEEIEEKCKEKIKEETKYQKFFKKKLADMGVKSPAELSDEKKKEFFNVIDKEWKAEKETD